MYDTDSAPDSVLELARACDRYVKGALGIDLDWSPDTLPLVDHYLDTAKHEFEKRPELMPVVVAAAAAYFGEVVRRHRPHARWALPSEDPASWRIEFDHVFLYFHPVGVVVEQLDGREHEGSGAHLETLSRDRGLLDQALSRAGSVGEHDYFRLTMRFEVLELVTEALYGATIARGQPERFSPDVYRAAADEPDTTSRPS